jgi:hypothetical protein
MSEGSVDGRPAQVVYVGKETHPQAIYAIVAAVAAWFTCPVVGALISLSFCRDARLDIEASGGEYGGEGLLTAARVLSWVHLAALVPTALFLAVSFAGAN